MSVPKSLSASQLRGLVRVGDIVIPGSETLPSFRASGAAQHADRMLDHMAASDRSGVKLLLTIFAFLPRFVISGILHLSEQDKMFPWILGAACRMVNIGIKGVVMTLYYSDLGDEPSILPAIGYDAQVRQHPDEAAAP